MTHLAYYLASDIPALAKKSSMDNKLAELNTGKKSKAVVIELNYLCSHMEFTCGAVGPNFIWSFALHDSYIFKIFSNFFFKKLYVQILFPKFPLKFILFYFLIFLQFLSCEFHFPAKFYTDLSNLNIFVQVIFL